VEAGQCPELKNIADCIPINKSFWAQWNSQVLRYGMQECHWESVDGRTKTAKIVLPWSRVKEVLAELHGGPSGHLGIRKTSDKDVDTADYSPGVMSRGGTNNVTPAQ
jgi:hypothetical protein